MKKKIIILGSNGMAGHVMTQFLSRRSNYEVIGVARQAGNLTNKILDVTEFDRLENFIRDSKPNYIVNCIGSLVSQSNNNLTQTILLNSYLPNYLSQLGNKLNFKLIHISTDCVFSGKTGQYTEKSFRDGDDNYARTKSLGEVSNNKDLTIRTSIIGPELKTNGTGLLDWFFKQNGSVKGFSKAYWSGVTTLELAKATEQLIEQNISGLYQLSSNTKISKYHLLKLFANIWNKKIEIIPTENYQIDKSLICTRTDFNFEILDFEKMLIETKLWMNEHPNYYHHYLFNK
jgi:dTDP-4-dehydrorhamnose reductase